MSQEVSNFFVSEARRNMHRANSITEEDDQLVYNWVPHFTGVWGGGMKCESLPTTQQWSLPGHASQRPSLVHYSLVHY